MRNTFLVSKAYLLINLNYSLIQHILKLDFQIKDARPGLIANVEQVLEPFCGDQSTSFSFALKQGIGGHLYCHTQLTSTMLRLLSTVHVAVDRPGHANVMWPVSCVTACVT